MEFKITTIVLLTSILFTGMTSGLCFTWSNAVTPGIGRLDDLSFLQSFQAMNRVIINPKFLLVFFSPTVLLWANVFLYRQANPMVFWLLVLAAVLFFGGVGLVTIFGNVPLNELLEATLLEELSATELKNLRIKFEEPWNRWHMNRTITSFLAFSLLLVALINNR